MQVFGVQFGNLASVAGATVNSRWQLVQTNRMASHHSRMKVHVPLHPRQIDGLHGLGLERKHP
jgi:hypothetical protein